jgi:hypothetical protein
MYALLISIILFAAPQNPINKDIPAKHKQTQSGRNTKSETLAVAPANSPNPEPRPAPKPKNQEHDAGTTIQRIEISPKASSDAWIKGYVIVTGAIAVINVFMFIAMWLQRNTMQDQLQEMKNAREQTVAEMQAASQQTASLITHAESQVAALQTAATAAKDSAGALVSSERAWIIIHVRDFPDRSSLYFQFSAINYGRTPARIVMEEWDYQYVTDPLKMPTPPHYKHAEDEIFLHQKIVMPRRADKNFYAFNVRNLWAACNEETQTAIQQNNKHLVTWGRVVYFDISGKRRETRFCFRFNPTTHELNVTGPWGYNDHT